MPIYTKDVAIKDGEDTAQGAKADAVATTDTGTFSGISFWKYLHQKLTGYFGGSISNVAITTQAKLLAGGKSKDITVNTASTIGNSQMLLFDSVTGALQTTIGDLQDYIDSITVAGRTGGNSSTVTRPSNMAPYEVGDVIGGLFTFANCSRGVGVSGLQDLGGYVMAIRVKALKTAIPAGTKVYLHLLAASISVTDNAQFVDAGGGGYLIGVYELTLDNYPKTHSGATYVNASFIPFEVFRTSSTTWYGVLVAGDAFTSTANAGDITVTVVTDIN